MTRGVTAKEQRRREETTPLPPALRAELRARTADAAGRRNAVLEEAKRQRRRVERDAAETFERVRQAAQGRFELERAEIRSELERRAQA